jgi:hypothetical protein
MPGLDAYLLADRPVMYIPKVQKSMHEFMLTLQKPANSVCRQAATRYQREQLFWWILE